METPQVEVGRNCYGGLVEIHLLRISLLCFDINISQTEYMLIGSRQRLSQVSADPIFSMRSEGIKHVPSTQNAWRNSG